MFSCTTMGIFFNIDLSGACTLLVIPGYCSLQYCEYFKYYYDLIHTVSIDRRCTMHLLSIPMIWIELYLRCFLQYFQIVHYLKILGTTAQISISGAFESKSL